MDLLSLIPTKQSTQGSLVEFFEIIDDPNRLYGYAFEAEVTIKFTSTVI